MRFNATLAGLIIAAGTSSAALSDGVEPLISEFANSGTMVVNGNEAFYDPSQGEAFEAGDGGRSNSNGWGRQQSVTYTAEGTVTSEVIDGIAYKTVTDPSGRIVRSGRAVQTY